LCQPPVYPQAVDTSSAQFPFALKSSCNSTRPFSEFLIRIGLDEIGFFHATGD
jgi:hypothetical protein